MSEAKPGDIVWGKFPTKEGGELTHPMLVLEVQDSVSGTTYVRCAYGSSKKVSASGHLDCEFVISDKRGIALAGLREPTRFDLRLTARMPQSEVSVIGKVALEDKAVFARLRKAMMATI